MVLPVGTGSLAVYNTVEKWKGNQVHAEGALCEGQPHILTTCAPMYLLTLEDQS